MPNMPNVPDLSVRQLIALEKIGNIYIPGDEEFPCFSDSNCIRHLNRIMDHMPLKDKQDLAGLLSVLFFFPGTLLYCFIFLLEKIGFFPSFPGSSVFRLVRLGLRGVVFSLYYGDLQILTKLEYSVSVYKQDLKM